MKQLVASCMGLVLMMAFGANAETVQGQLELRWGDPVPVQGKASGPARFVVNLVGEDGSRRRLDPVQARRAAVDLYALGNRRVAVQFAPAKRAGTAPVIAAIVPIDRPWLPASSKALVEAKVAGNTRWVTLACKFSDIAAEQSPVSFFNDQYATSAGRLGHYWQEVSYGKINLTGSSAYGWFTLPQPRSFYVTTVDGKDKANLDQLFKDCAALADPVVNFNAVQGINMMFNGDLDGSAWGGGACGVLEGVSQCIRNTWNPPWSFGNLAPLAHEMGHGYGLPHSDNSDGDDDPYDNPWDVMSDAWSNAPTDPLYGRLPKHINTVQRERLGWVDPARKLSVGVGGAHRELVLDRASLAGSTNRQMITLNTRVSDERGIYMYVVEARKRAATTPSNPYSYESLLAGDAVIIHAVSTSFSGSGEMQLGMAYSMDAQVPPADRSNNEGSMFKVGETWVSPDGSQRVAVVGETANGFVVNIGWPRATGGDLRPRTRPSAVAPVTTAASQPAASATARPARPAAGRCASQARDAGAAACNDRER